MNTPNPAALLLGAVILLVTVELLRRRTLREKYAALWLAVSVATVVLALAPGLLVALADVLGFTVPANLLFFVGGVMLTIISMQLSLEIGRLDDNSQRLAEEVALLRLEIRTMRSQQHDLIATDGDVQVDVPFDIPVDVPFDVQVDVQADAEGSSG